MEVVGSEKRVSNGQNKEETRRSLLENDMFVYIHSAFPGYRTISGSDYNVEDSVVPFACFHCWLVKRDPCLLKSKKRGGHRLKMYSEGTERYMREVLNKLARKFCRYV